MSNVDIIKKVEFSGGTSSDIHRRLQEKAMNDKIMENYDVSTIDCTIEEFDDVLTDSGLKEAISKSRQGAEQGDFVDIKTEYWNDKPLRFDKNGENGTYLVKQQDDNGNWVSMGWTTEEVAMDYMYKINGGGINYVTQSDKTLGTVSKPKDEELVKIDDKVSDEQKTGVLAKTGATIATGAISVGEGLVALGENIVDIGATASTIAATPGYLLVDLLGWTASKVTGNEWESVTKKAWNDTKSFTSKDYSSTWFDKFYDNTSAGNYLKENSYGFETTRKIGKGVGYVGGLVAITFLTMGLGSTTATGTALTTTSGGGAVGTASTLGGAGGAGGATAAGSTLAIGTSAGAGTGAAAGGTVYTSGQSVLNAVKAGQLSRSGAIKALKSIYGNLADGGEAHAILAEMAKFW